MANVALATGLLYFWGAAYYTGYAGALGVPTGIADFSTPTFLLASWLAISEVTVSSVRAWLVILILAGIIWGLGSLADLIYLLVKRILVKRSRAPKRAKDAKAKPNEEPPPAPPQRTPEEEAIARRLADLSARVDVASEEFLYQAVLVMVVTLILIVGLKTRERMVKLGEDAGRLALERCHPATIVRADSSKTTRPAVSDRRLRIAGKSDTTPLVAERPLRFCARLGDRLVFRRDSTYLIADRADVKQFELIGAYPYTTIDQQRTIDSIKADSIKARKR